MLDKSSFQNLSTREHHFASKHYYLNIPPILLVELVTGIRKYSKDKVSELSKRLSAHSITNDYFVKLFLGSLLGYDFEIDGRPIVTPTQVVDNNGGQGILIDNTEESLMFIRWQNGEFNESEEEFASVYGKIISDMDMDELLNKAGRLSQDEHRVKDINDIAMLVENQLASKNQADQLIMLQWLLNSIVIDEEYKTQIFNRWLQGEHTSIEKFSRYAHYILKVLLVFHYATRFELIGTKRTNIIDLQYLFYLPFCYIFSSCDEEQIKLAKCLMLDYQMFVHGNELKKDLANIINWWDSLTEEEREEYSQDYGSYPPELKQSFTLEAWKKYCKPRQKGSGNRVAKMSKEEQEQIVNEINKKMEAFNK